MRRVGVNKTALAMELYAEDPLLSIITTIPFYRKEAGGRRGPGTRNKLLANVRAGMGPRSVRLHDLRAGNTVGDERLVLHGAVSCLEKVTLLH